MDDIRLEADISLENGNVNRQVNRRRNERDRLREDEINNQQNARYAARRPANNSNPNEKSLVRRVENNRRRNEEIGFGEMKLIINKMLEMLLDMKECLV